MLLPYQEIFIWALLISFLLSVIYRIFTKPKEIRKLKEDMKFYREKSNEARKSKDMKKMEEYSSEMLKLSQKQMKHNMKPMFISMGLILIILGFVSTTYNGVTVQTNPIDERTSMGYFSYGDFNHSLRSEKINETHIKVFIDTNDNGDFSDETGYLKDQTVLLNNIRWSVSPQDMNQTSMLIIIDLPFTIPLFGWSHLNWLWWYILITLPATWIFRKMLGVE
jgi:uncharacterized membrane protein (DUF106 family)